ncbi:MAG TPA: hypothetical protein PLO53_07195 [Candidatus Hydrogenedentes bacterium]|nr:hypothetical protein [Candidatus Hydrogenedentota bacterium]
MTVWGGALRAGGFGGAAQDFEDRGLFRLDGEGLHGVVRGFEPVPCQKAHHPEPAAYSGRAGIKKAFLDQFPESGDAGGAVRLAENGFDMGS